jgi:hypothetical protein
MAETKIEYNILKNYIEKDIANIFSTSNKIFSIHFLEYDEPNYGRMLQVFKLFKYDEDITPEFYSTWNYTELFGKSFFEFSTSDDNYCFLPHEMKPKIVNLKDLSAFEVSIEGNLIGNIFTSSKNILIFTTKKIYSIDLLTNKIIEKSPDINYQFPIYFQEKIILISRSTFLYEYDLKSNQHFLIEEISAPKTIFPNPLFQEYEEIKNDENCGFTYAIGNRSSNRQKTSCFINSWEFIAYCKNKNSLILGTNVPISKSKETDAYSYTIWFNGKIEYVELKLNTSNEKNNYTKFKSLFSNFIRTNKTN